MKPTNKERIEILEKVVAELIVRIDKLMLQGNFIELEDDADKANRAEKEKGLIRYGN